MVNVVCHCGWTNNERQLSDEEDASLRVLGDHLHRDGLHFWVLLQAALSPENGQQEGVKMLLILFRISRRRKHWNMVWTLLETLAFRNIAIPSEIKIYVMLSNLWVFKTLVILCLICVFAFGRWPRYTHNSRPLPDILYPPNGHCVLSALKQFILGNTQNIDHSCALD